MTTDNPTWEEKFNKKFIGGGFDEFTITTMGVDSLKGFIATIIDEEQEKLIKQVLAILTDEISLSHTTAGKTSRLTSAYTRIQELIKPSV